LVSIEKHGDIEGGKGPDLTFGPAVHNNLLKLIREAAEANEIPYQLSASSRITGTDTDAFAFSNGGVPSALVSLPIKYMHTTVEMAHKDDVENVIKLIYEALQCIEDKQDFRYFT
jgi:putative aminopeptidase FrvX